MYIPAQFRQHDRATLHALMRAHNFATVVTHDGVPFASHLPLLIDEERGPNGTLLGHMARANPQWRHFREQSEVLVIFQGPHGYVSPSWYGPGENVPTWNYAVVHAYGRPRLMSDDETLMHFLERLVDYHEAGFERPWRLDTESAWARSLLSAIVGFEIEITRLEGKFKLGQNRTPSEWEGAVAALLSSLDVNDRELGELMQRSGCPATEVKSQK